MQTSSSGVKLAPVIEKVSVVTWQKRKDHHVWYTVLIQPRAKKTITCNGDEIEVPRQPYVIFRQYEEFQQLDDALQEALSQSLCPHSSRTRQNHRAKQNDVALFMNPSSMRSLASLRSVLDRPVIYSHGTFLKSAMSISTLTDFDSCNCSHLHLPTLRPNTAFFITKSVCEQRRMHLDHYVRCLFQQPGNYPTLIASSQPFLEFCGIRRSDLDYKMAMNLGDPLNLQMPMTKTQETIRIALRGRSASKRVPRSATSGGPEKASPMRTRAGAVRKIGQLNLRDRPGSRLVAPAKVRLSDDEGPDEHSEGDDVDGDHLPLFKRFHTIRRQGSEQLEQVKADLGRESYTFLDLSFDFEHQLSKRQSQDFFGLKKTQSQPNLTKTANLFGDESPDNFVAQFQADPNLAQNIQWIKRAKTLGASHRSPQEHVEMLSPEQSTDAASDNEVLQRWSRNRCDSSHSSDSSARNSEISTKNDDPFTQMFEQLDYLSIQPNHRRVRNSTSPSPSLSSRHVQRPACPKSGSPSPPLSPTTSKCHSKSSALHSHDSTPSTPSTPSSLYNRESIKLKIVLSSDTIVLLRVPRSIDWQGLKDKIQEKFMSCAEQDSSVKDTLNKSWALATTGVRRSYSSESLASGLPSPSSLIENVANVQSEDSLRTFMEGPWKNMAKVKLTLVET
ncbi:hypothetical protein BZG36_03201 [Bifiguratus adelaidae]|uniref:PX domain-containing protein n=1 Tax=Bifiguratus adelaidae TaxID=1938954 RepID=A0A261Y171_9FUNG|nr:hypothetical protein BZG36_03201 [Bifiguratus adelaidae]